MRAAGGVLVFLGVIIALLTCGEPAQKKTAGQAPEEILIKFKPHVADDSIQTLMSRLGLEKVRELGEIGVKVYRSTSRLPFEQVLRECQTNPHIEYAEPNFRYRIPEKNR